MLNYSISVYTVPGHKSWSAGSFLKQNYPKYSHFYCSSQIFRLRHLAPFDWKFLQNGALRAKDLRKN